MSPSASDRREILVVEESPSIAHELSNFDDSITVLSQKPAALNADARLLEKADWSMVIVDMEHESSLGAEIVKKVKIDRPRMPVLIIANAHDREDVVSVLGLPNVSVIQRPYSAEDVGARALRALRATENEKRGVPGINHFVRAVFELSYRTDEIGPWHLAGFISNLLRGSGFCDDDSANRIETAVNEAVVNAVEHGNLELDSSLKPESLEKPDRFAYLKNLRMSDEKYGSRRIHIKFRFEQCCMTVTVSDEGKGFDHRTFMENLHTKTEPENLLECHGRGLLMVRHSMDEVSFNERGNEITMVKHLTPREACRSSENSADT